MTANHGDILLYKPFLKSPIHGTYHKIGNIFNAPCFVTQVLFVYKWNASSSGKPCLSTVSNGWHSDIKNDLQMVILVEKKEYHCTVLLFCLVLPARGDVFLLILAQLPHNEYTARLQHKEFHYSHYTFSHYITLHSHYIVIT